MDRRERVADPLVGLQAILGGLQARIWTAMPGILQSYDATKLTCTVQVAIKAQHRDPAGKWTDVALPLLVDVPVVMPRGGGYGLTLPLAANDEGLVVFASRCIDAWWQSGGVQPQAEFRMHDLSDGFFIPGTASQPNVPEGVSTSAARLWSEDGLNYVELDKTLGTVHAKSQTRITLESPVTEITGGLVVGGVISGQVGGGGVVNFGTAQVLQGGKDIGAVHTHGGVQPGGGNSGPVT